MSVSAKNCCLLLRSGPKLVHELVVGGEIVADFQHKLWTTFQRGRSIFHKDIGLFIVYSGVEHNIIDIFGTLK